MAVFTYPTHRELREIGPEKVARMSDQRLGFEIMPMRNADAAIIQWTQRDNFFGLQQIRGLDGAPSHVKRVGRNRFTYEPGVYGEFQTISETELTQRAQGADESTAVNVTDLVAEGQTQLIGRELDLQEKIIWDVLIDGTFQILDGNGTVMYAGTFDTQEFSGSDWADLSNATPLADFRALNLLSTGKGVRFGAGAMACMNQVTYNRMMNNQNSADLHNRFTTGGANPTRSFANVNSALQAEDAPQIRIYQEGYFDDNDQHQLFIPNDKVVVVGQRTTNELVGEYRLTKNANNPGYAPGSYDLVKDKTGNGPDGQRQVPPTIEVHRGHNGGPVLYFPSAIVVMDVGGTG